jgi:hypothetical protein
VVLGNLTQEARSSFTYGAITLSGRRFHSIQLEGGFVTPRPNCARIRPGPTTPAAQRTQALAYSRFGLIPFRSPLLGESRLLSFPRGTKMFQFPPFAPPRLCVHPSGDPALPGPGFPIRASPGLSLFAATRSLSQLTTPFIASSCQGIPRVPLVASPVADSEKTSCRRTKHVQGRSLSLLFRLSKNATVEPRTQLDTRASTYTAAP